MKNGLRRRVFSVSVGLLAGIVAVAAAGCSSKPHSPIQLTDVTATSGISFRHTDGAAGRYYLPEPMSAGLALLDYDGDGDLDVYFVNGSPLPPAAVETLPGNALYRNEGGFRFVDVTREAGVGDAGFGLGVAVGDIDNDGHLDLFVTNFGPDVLFRNNGDGTFSDVTSRAGVGGGKQLSSGACFLDFDNDGHLDLFVARYADFSCEGHVAETVDGLPVYPGPLSCTPLADTLYRNSGDGAFAETNAESSAEAGPATTTSAIAVDFDQDGDTDVFVAGDGAPNRLLVNDGAGKLTDAAEVLGLAYNADGIEQRNRGADCADFDNDGQYDFLVTSGAGQWPALYRNLGEAGFEDVTFRAGAGVVTLPHAKWGAGLVDLDNDADRDLFIACADPSPERASIGGIANGGATNVLLMNSGDGRFADVTSACGSGLSVVANSRGVAFGDLDNDGDLDAIVLNSRQLPTVLRNDSPAGNHWIQIRLEGSKSNRSGLGCRVRVKAGDLTQVAEVHGSRGYQSHWGIPLHFGLAAQRRVEQIEVFWPSGEQDVLTEIEADQILAVREGETGSTASGPGQL